MTDIRMEKFQEACKDKEYVKELMALESIEEIKAKLAEAGVDLTTEEVEELVDAVVANMEAPEGELNENALEGVTGGGIILGMAILVGMTALGVYIGWKAAGGCKRR